MYWLKRIVLSSLFCLLAWHGYGQTDTLISVEQPDSKIQVSTDTFNYVFPAKDRPDQLLAQFLDRILENSIDFNKSLAAMNARRDAEISYAGMVKSERPSWVLYCVFGLFVAIAIVRLLFPGDFSMIVQAYYHERTLQQVSKEDNMLTSWPYILLYLIFSLALGLFITLVESSFMRLDVLNWNNYLRTAGIVAILFILKILFIRFISFVFEIGRLVREYVTVLYLVYFNSMLFLMPVLLVVTLVPTNYFKFVLIFFSTLVSMLFIYRFLRTAFRLFGNLKFSIFYLILYLCALEVAPILILVKTLSN